MLGGGGVLGEAWLRALLAGLEAAHGWDLRECDAFVGTSAGSIVAAVLAAGRRPEAAEGVAAAWEHALRRRRRPAPAAVGRGAAGPGARASLAGALAAPAAPFVAAGARPRRRRPARGDPAARASADP